MTIEYTYTTYKMPESQEVTGGSELAKDIASKVLPEETNRGCLLWKIKKDEKFYICGFVSNVVHLADLPTKEYFVTVEVGTDGNVSHVNCYKCTIGKLNNAHFASGWDGIAGNKMMFGCDNGTFYIPPHSFFLEGAHEAFNDLPAGTYSGNDLVKLN